MVAIKRLGTIVLVLCGTGAAGLLAGAAAGPGGGLTLSVSGPTEVVGIPAPRYVLTATITNTGDVPATGVTISSTFPGSDAREEITGVVDCDGSGLHIDVCTVPDIPAGGNAVVTWRYAPTEYGIDRHHLVASSTSPASSDEADHDVRVLGPPGSTDWRVVVTPAVGMGGLRARHEVIVTNLGPATATAAVFNEQLVPGEQVIGTSLGQSCALMTASVLHCSLGTLAARQSVTVAVDTKLPPNPTDAFHVVDVGSNTPAMSASHLFGSAPATGPWRYWLCAECLSTTFPDGFVLPSGFTVLPDETVSLGGGSAIRPDGVLVRADGKLVLTDGTTTSAPASPPGAPTGVTAAPGDGEATIGFVAPADNGLPVTSYTVTSSPGGYVYSGTDSPIVARGLENGTSYTFTVTAANGAGPGPPSAASGAVTLVATPEPPTGVAAAGGDRQAAVTFSPSSSGGVVYYTAIAFPGGRIAHGTESPILVGGLENGTAYTFSVTATNASGAGRESESSNAVVPAESSRPHEPPPAEAERSAPPEPPPPSGPRAKLPGH